MIKISSAIFKTFFLSLCILANTHFAFAQTASVLPPGYTQYLDSNGKPLSAGKVYNYIPNTTTFKTTWQDAAETIPNANPVVLDAAGRAKILGDGSYRQIVKDRNNVTIWDAVTSSTGSGSSSPTATGDGDLVGTIKPWSGIIAPNQYAFAYGQELSRTTYDVLYSAITSTQPVFCTSGSPTLTGLADTNSFWIGMSVEISCVPSGFTTIIAKTASTVTMNTNANVSSNVNAVFYPWGRGNGTTTFNLPDLRGITLVGNNIMGGVSSSNLTATYFGATDPNSIGALGGSQSNTLTTANIASHNHSVYLNDPGHNHTYNQTILGGTSSTFSTGSNAAFLTSNTNSSVTGITIRDTNNAGGVANQTNYTGGGVAVSAVIGVAGSGYTNGSQVLTISGGTCTTQPQFTVTVSGGALTGTPSLLTAGSCTVAPTNPASFTGGGAGSSGSLNVIYSAQPISRIQPSLTINYIIKITPDTNSAIASGVTSLGGMTGDIACGTGLSCTGNIISANGVAAGGSNTQVQFNNSGSLSGSSCFIWVSPLLTVGCNGTSSGKFGLAGSTSGTLIQTVGAIAGTPIITWGNSTGTPVVTASAPLVINTTTGNLTITASALTKVDDTNVTLTLGGSPSTALLASASLTLGWTGTLAVSRGGTGQSTLTTNAFLTGNGTGNVNQVTLTGAVLGNGASAPTAYAGQICTNQVATALSSSLGITCTTINNSYLASGTYSNITGVGTLTAGATGSGFTLNFATSTLNGSIPIANGGTSQATALAARSSSGLNIDGATSTGDANYAILSTDRMVYHTALTAARTDTLPAANSVNSGQVFYITDFRGVASGTNTITLQRSGSDTINGATTVVAINAQYGAGIFWSDGVSRWTFQPTSSGGGGGTVTQVVCDGVTITTSGTCPPKYDFVNCSLAVSAAASALTIALKDASGSNPTSSSPCTINFRNVTATSGSWSQLSITAANSLVISSGSTLGVTSSLAFRLWIVGFNDAGTFRLGVINTQDSTHIYPLNVSIPQSSTAEGGAGGADSAGVIYTGTAVTSKSAIILGYVEWSSSGLTAGTWTTTNLLAIVSMGTGIKKPGDVVQTMIIPGTGGQSRACATSYADVTGTSMVMTPTSAANSMFVSYTGLLEATAGGAGVNTRAMATVAVAGTAASSASTTDIGVTSGSGTNMQSDGALSVQLWHNANSTSAQTYTLQTKGLNTSGNCNSTTVFGRVDEIMR